MNSEPLSMLIAALEEAQHTAAGDESGRATIIPALGAVLTYLRTVGVDTRLRAPLFHLLAALGDAEAGRNNPILSPASFQDGTPKKKAFERHQWTMAVVGVDILHKEAKWSVTKALKHMASAIGVDSKELAEFRKNLGKRRVHQDILDDYQWWLQTRRHYRDQPAEQFVSVMVTRGAELTIK